MKFFLELLKDVGNEIQEELNETIIANTAAGSNAR